LGSNIS